MRTWFAAAAAAFLGLVFMAAIRVPGMSDLAISLMSNGGQLAAAVAASVGCAVAARRTADHRRTAWWWLAAGTGWWAAGQVVWSYYEVVLGREVPFPSLADIGFLLFPLVAAVGLLIWLGTQGDQLVARTRDIFDGAIIACSLLVVSWVTTLGSVVAAGADSWFPLVLSLAYPVGDLMLATLVLLALARDSGAERATLAILALGLGGLAFADSAYVYLTSVGAYSSTDLVSSGWVFGFFFVAAAGMSVRRDVHNPAPRSKFSEQDHVALKPSLLRLTLPYVPLVAAGLTLCVSLLSAPDARTVELLLAVTLMTFVLTRQFLAMTDNQRLLGDLADAHEQLEHQALHDALTGLANRVLFADRLDRALLKPDAEVSVLFCDIDDFKVVNDQYGHEVGDDLLKLVAGRLLDCVRVTDTVARLGGDEFAILIEDSTDAVQVADRIVTNIREPLEIRGRTLSTSISVGIAHHVGRSTSATENDRRDQVLGPAPRTRVASADAMAATAEREAAAALLVRTADTAMYAAKGAGKSRAVLADIIAGPSLS